MAIVECKVAEYDRNYSEDDQGGRSYDVDFLVRTDTDAHTGSSVVLLAEAVSSPNDPLPLRGAHYAFHDVVDLGSFCKNRVCKLVSKQDPTLWIITANFRPLSMGEPDNKYSQDNPLNWDAVRWFTWVEDQYPVEEAECLTVLDHLERGPNFSGNEPGPLVNAAGEQTIDPVMIARYHPVLNVEKYYTDEDDITLLNQTFQDTTNDDTWYNRPAKTWRYLITEAQRPEKKNVEGVGNVWFQKGITRVEFNKRTWIRNLLNNGMNSFKKSNGTDYDLVGGEKALFDILVDDGDGGTTPTSEPLNLKADGTYELGIDANAIAYQELTESDYGTMGIGG